MFFLDIFNSILSNLSNDTKITQNRDRMKKLWQKENRGAEKGEVAKTNSQVAKIRNLYIANFF